MDTAKKHIHYLLNIIYNNLTHNRSLFKLLTKSIAGSKFYDNYIVCVSLRCGFNFCFRTDAIVIESLNPKIVCF